MFEPLVVPSFGGGLSLPTNPASLRDDQWTWAEHWYAKDGYAEVANGYTQLATVGTGTEQIIGMLQNPFTWDGALVVTVDSSGKARGYTVNGAGTVVTLAGVYAGVPGVSGVQTAVLQGGFLNGFLVTTTGANPQLTATSLVKWAGGTPTAAVTSPSAFVFYDFLVGFAAHLVAAVGVTNSGTAPVDETMTRTIAWSNVNDQSEWNPAITNDSDTVFLDDADSGITGVIPFSPSTLGIFTRNSIQILVATGGIPAFTRQQLLRGIGCQQIRTSAFSSTDMTQNRRQSFYGPSPYGAIFYGADNLYRTAGGFPEPIGTPIFRWWTKNLQPTADPAVEHPKPFVWHEDLGLLLIPRPIAGTTDTAEMLVWDARTDAWSRVQFGHPANDPTLRQAFIYDFTGGLLERRHWWATKQKIFRENPSATTAGFVQTKDFHFADPSTDDYVDRIKVDWEPLTNATTDALQVAVSFRNDLSKSLLGSSGLETQGVTFTTAGTLTGGDSELMVRGRGKYVRFQFTNTSGRCRIRGFTIRRQRGSERTT